MADKQLQFVPSKVEHAQWQAGMRLIFDYRDLGIKYASAGDFVAHVVPANSETARGPINQWQVDGCQFQMIYIVVTRLV